MKKWLIFGAMLALTACAGSGGKQGVAGLKFPVLSADPLDGIVKDITDNSQKFQNKKIVVYEFQDLGGRLKAEGRLIAERLTTKLVRTGEFEVIERGRLESVLQELRLSASGVVDDKTALKAGEILGAGAVITGTLARVDGKFEINARAINVAGGRILTASIARISEESLRIAAEKDAAAPVQVQYNRQPPAPQGQDSYAGLPVQGQALPGWKIWPGLNNSYGRFGFAAGKLSYYLARRQHDGGAYETGEATGYYPGLLLSRRISGRKWEIAVKADYRLNSSNGHWFSSYVWLGTNKTRPSWNARGMDMAIGLFHKADLGSGTHACTEFGGAAGGKDLGTKILDRNFRYFKIRRNGNDFYLESSEDGIKYEQVLHVKAPVNIDSSTQEIVLGGQCFGDPAGSYADYEYAKFNGRALF